MEHCKTPDASNTCLCGTCADDYSLSGDKKTCTLCPDVANCAAMNTDSCQGCDTCAAKHERSEDRKTCTAASSEDVLCERLGLNVLVALPHTMHALSVQLPRAKLAQHAASAPRYAVRGTGGQLRHLLAKHLHLHGLRFWLQAGGHNLHGGE